MSLAPSIQRTQPPMILNPSILNILVDTSLPEEVGIPLCSTMSHEQIKGVSVPIKSNGDVDVSPLRFEYVLLFFWVASSLFKLILEYSLATPLSWASMGAVGSFFEGRGHE